MLYNLSSDGFDCPLSSVCSEGFEQSQYSYGGIGSFWFSLGCDVSVSLCRREKEPLMCHLVKR